MLRGSGSRRRAGCSIALYTGYVPTCCHLPWPQALEAERKRGAAAAEEAGAALEAARAAHRQAAAEAERRLQVARPLAVPRGAAGRAFSQTSESAVNVQPEP